MNTASRPVATIRSAVGAARSRQSAQAAHAVRYPLAPHASCSRLASTSSTSSRPSTSPSSPPAGPIRVAPFPTSSSTNISPKPSSEHRPGHPALRSAWPWRPVSPAFSGSASPLPAGVIEEERVIYARPYEGPLGTRVKMLWFLFPFGGLVIGMYITTPKLKRRGEVDGDAGVDVEGGSKGKDGEHASSQREKSQGEWVVDEPRPWYWAPDNLAVILAAMSVCAVWTFMPTRFVTRLALIRRHAGPGQSSSGKVSGQAKEFIRMQHGGHLMSLGVNVPMRDIPLEDVSVKAIGQPGATSYLSLKVRTHTTAQKFGLDRFGYRLDFRDTKVVKDSKDEVVLSLNRLEHVFGSLR